MIYISVIVLFLSTSVIQYSMDYGMLVFSSKTGNPWNLSNQVSLDLALLFARLALILEFHFRPALFNFLNEISLKIKKNKRAGSGWDRPVPNPSIVIFSSVYY